MLAVEDAIERIAHALGRPCPSMETVPLACAAGRVLARDVAMDHDVPPFDRATMDGYAVGGPVVPGTVLQVVGRVVAGASSAGSVGPGDAMRIMTGAPLPAGTERVLPFEWTRSEGAEVVVTRLPREATCTVARGAHVAAGDVVLAAGTRLGAGAAGALATAGCDPVPVAVRPRVAILATGSELVPVAEAPGPGRIRNSNAPLLAALVERAGGEARVLPTAPDEVDGLCASIRAGLEADVLLVSGGVSRGDLDLVPGALEAEGVETVFHRWAVQPGGPLLFGMAGATPVFGLPGNPAAAFVGFELLVVPALGTLSGQPFEARRTWRAHFVGPWGAPAARRRYRPVRLTTDDAGRLLAQAQPWRGSGDPFALAGAEGLAALPERTDASAAREPLVDVLPLGGLA